MSNGFIDEIRENAINNIAAEREEKVQYITQNIDELKTCQIEIAWDLIKKMVEVNA